MINTLSTKGIANSSVKPLVSVVIAAYNHQQYVETAIRSVLEQTYENIELVVVDDGSADKTWDVIQRLHNEIKTSVSFKIYTKKNQGLSATLNYGIARTSGEYIALLASDDYYAKNKIEKQIDLFKASSPSTALVHSSAYYFFYASQKIFDMTGLYRAACGCNFTEMIEKDVSIIAPTIMFKRTAYNDVGGFDESLAIEDYPFLVALAAKGFEFAYDPTPLIYKREIENSLGKQVEKIYEVHLRLFEKYKNRFSSFNYIKIRNKFDRLMLKNSACGGNLKFSFYVCKVLSVRTQSIIPFFYLFLYSYRYLFFRICPGRIQSKLRLMRASIFKKIIL